MATLERTESKTTRHGKKNVRPIGKKTRAPGVSLPATHQKNVSVAAGTKMRDVRQKLGVNQFDFGRLAGISVRNISAIETGVKQPTSADLRRFNELERLQSHLAKIMKADFIAQWLHQPSELFGGLKPLEIIERGEVDRIWRMIYHIQGGGMS